MTWWVEPKSGGGLLRFDSPIARDLTRRLVDNGVAVSACGDVRVLTPESNRSILPVTGRVQRRT